MESDRRARISKPDFTTYTASVIRRTLVDMCITPPIVRHTLKYERVLIECGAYAYIRYMQKRGYDRKMIVALAMQAVRNKYLTA